ncbi:hypothetical protein [Bosea sp. (in: a-proteobacteria)]|uniref:hypothetical protein n=1 Tax=Bosea sp. (in: a-proteobacteria) TaxID=1871050 RepID=UPI003B3B805C
MKRLALALAALLCAPASQAQTTFPSQVPGGFPPPTVPNYVPGFVPLCLNASGVAVPCSSAAPGYVQTPTPSTVIAGQGRIATASTAVCLPSAALQNGIVVKALAGNVGSLTVGPSGVTTATDGTGNGYVLAPGEAMSFAVSNASLVCFNGTGVGDGVSYAGN